jgi:hypothetical protein
VLFMPQLPLKCILSHPKARRFKILIKVFPCWIAGNKAVLLYDFHGIFVNKIKFVSKGLG